MVLLELCYKYTCANWLWFKAWRYRDKNRSSLMLRLWISHCKYLWCPRFKVKEGAAWSALINVAVKCKAGNHDIMVSSLNLVVNDVIFQVHLARVSFDWWKLFLVRVLRSSRCKYCLFFIRILSGCLFLSANLHFKSSSHV